MEEHLTDTRDRGRKEKPGRLEGGKCDRSGNDCTVSVRDESNVHQSMSRLTGIGQVVVSPRKGNTKEATGVQNSHWRGWDMVLLVVL